MLFLLYYLFYPRIPSKRNTIYKRNKKIKIIFFYFLFSYIRIHFHLGRLGFWDKPAAARKKSTPGFSFRWCFIYVSIKRDVLIVRHTCFKSQLLNIFCVCCLLCCLARFFRCSLCCCRRILRRCRCLLGALCSFF